MLRRSFIAGAGAASLLGASLARAQTSSIPVIGFLAGANRNAHVADMAGLRAGLREMGLAEGRDLRIEERYADGDRNRIAGLVDELLSRDVSVFLVPGLVAARAVSERTSKPVVAVALPYSNRHPELFAALNKPGGSLTGFSLGSEGLSAKRIQLLREAAPSITTLAVLHNGSDPIYNEWGIETEAAGVAQGLKVIRLGLNAPEPAALASLLKQAADDGVQGMVVIRDFLTATMTRQIAESAIATGIAALSEQRDFCDGGGLLSYGANVPDLFRRSATFIAKILNGSNPGELPIQLPTKFDLVVNAKTADALGLTIPPELFLQATEVIE